MHTAKKLYQARYFFYNWGLTITFSVKQFYLVCIQKSFCLKYTVNDRFNCSTRLTNSQAWQKHFDNTFSNTLFPDLPVLCRQSLLSFLLARGRDIKKNFPAIQNSIFWLLYYFCIIFRRIRNQVVYNAYIRLVLAHTWIPSLCL